MISRNNFFRYYQQSSPSILLIKIIHDIVCHRLRLKQIVMQLCGCTRSYRDRDTRISHREFLGARKGIGRGNKATQFVLHANTPLFLFTYIWTSRNRVKSRARAQMLMATVALAALPHSPILYRFAVSAGLTGRQEARIAR